jgi:hypothetical protein
MISTMKQISTLELPLIEDHLSMIPFDLATLIGIPKNYLDIVRKMISSVKHKKGTAYFTIHGKILKTGQTLRRGGPHTDGNYKPVNMTFSAGGGGGGWKIGENGPAVNSPLHARQYLSPKGGIIMVSNHSSCLVWQGNYKGTPGVGGDCSGIDLNKPELIKANNVVYGNNHLIHESLPVDVNVHRVMARITMPENHKYEL